MKRLWIVSACLAIVFIPRYSLHAEKGLLVHYAFQEGSGRVLRDSSGGHDGAIKGGAKWVKGLPFGALDFNGTNAHVLGPTDLPIGRVGTLEVWCSPRAVGGGLISWHLGPQWEDQRLVLGFSTYKGNNLIGVISNGALANIVQDPVPVDIVKRFSHMVIRFDERNIQFFRNGELLGSTTQLLVPDIKGVPMRIGLVSGLGVGYFDGMIAEVKVYNTALSDDQITAHCAERASVFQVVPRRTTQKQPPKLEKAEGAREQTRKLEKAERLTAVREDGYFPVLIRLKNGMLAAVVRMGAGHLDSGGHLDLITSRDGGRTWSAPRLIVSMPPSICGHALGQAADGRLICAFALTGPYRDGQYVFETQRYTMWVTRSKDNGETWTPPQQIKTPPYDHASPYGKIVLLPDGALLMALYGWWQPEREGGESSHDKKGYFAAVCRSEDNGVTWSAPIPIVGYVPGRRENTNYSEIALVVFPDGKVLAVMRGGPWDGLDQVISTDGGRTWGPIESVIRGLDRQPADVILLKSGRLLLAIGKRGKSPMGVEAVLSHNKPGQWDQLASTTPDPRPATPVRKAGQWDWQTHVSLEWNAASADCGYPSSVQLDDGTIVTLYYGVGELGKLAESGQGLMAYAKCVRYREADLAAVTTSKAVGSKCKRRRLHRREEKRGLSHR